MRRKQDGAFPMLPSGPRASTSSPYYKQYNDDDIPRPMCGQAALNKILAVGVQVPPVKPRMVGERRSLLGSPDSRKTKPYEKMRYDVNPMDNIYSADRSKFSKSVQDSQDSSQASDDYGAMIYIPQFNVQKAKQVQAKSQPTKASAAHRLPSMTEISRENGAEKSKGQPGLEKKPPMSIKERRIEEMIRSMHQIIMKQEENINVLGLENERYRENMSLFQDHVMALKQEQLNQKNEISKLHFEKESYEAEATTLREELQTLRSELTKAKSMRGISWTTKESSDQKTAQVAPWTEKIPTNEGATTSIGKEKSPSTKKDITASSVKRQSVSFGEHTQVLRQCQARDDAPSDMRWTRSRQRSIFNKDGKTTSEEPYGQNSDETREASPRHSHSSGKCSDLKELQAKANELRETVARMKLDSPPKKNNHSTSSWKSPGDDGSNDSSPSSFDERKRDDSPPKKHNHSNSSWKSPRDDRSNVSSPASFDERKRDAVLRYSRGDRPSYWNSYDLHRNPDDLNDVMYEEERDETLAT